MSYLNYRHLSAAQIMGHNVIDRWMYQYGVLV